MAPTIVWLRPGVGYAPAAAASMKRLEAALGRAHDCNSSYRDWDTQQSMYDWWIGWLAGKRPRPPFSRPTRPDLSKHCLGLADDSDDWQTPGYIELAEEHGWFRFYANDPTERHHFEYVESRDQHRNDPVPSDDIIAALPDPPKGIDMLIITIPDYGSYLDTAGDGMFALTPLEALVHRRAGVPSKDLDAVDENGTPAKSYLDLLVAHAWQRAGLSADRVADAVEKTIAEGVAKKDQQG